ncbi:MAG: hypothetical protein EXQ71_05905 [Acidimicrobiia bacterium]|nr:hypothetical protein [Acidimicrobiia bacterium]
MKMKKLALGSTLVVALFAFAACSSGQNNDAAVGADATDCPVGDGAVSVSGSSTVEPISAAVGEKLLDCGSGVAATVDGPGTGDGFVLFCKGEIDIADASRPMKPAEAEACAASGVEFIELAIGIDGLTVVTNRANDAVECLSRADLYALIGAESQGFSKWSDASGIASALGSTTKFPSADLDITGPGAESGTYDSFGELALKSSGEARAASGNIAEDEAEAIRPDYSSQADDTAIIAGVQGSDTSLGWVGVAYANEAGESVRVLPVASEPNGECIAPTPEAISSGDYPLSRELFIYVNAKSATDSEAVAAYVDYYLSEAGIASVEEVGYVGLDPVVLEESRSVWQAKELGTRQG